jgi:uncharacterized protein
MEYPEGEFTLSLFPLPTLVFFPHTRIPLHIFEPRYRKMVADALESGSMIGMALLRPVFERDSLGNPAIHDLGTAGAIEHVSEYEDGRYDIVLRGVVRYRILEPLDHRPYRIARVIADPEAVRDSESFEEQRSLITILTRKYLSSFRDQDVPEIETASLEALVNATAMALNIEPAMKQRLLEAGDLGERGEQVARLLEDQIQLLDFLEPFRRDGAPGSN